MVKNKKSKLKEEREKKILMWTGTTFFMILILFLWFINTELAVFGAAKNNSNSIDLDNVTNKFYETFEEIALSLEEAEDSINELKELSIGLSSSTQNIGLEGDEATTTIVVATTTASIATTTENNQINIDKSTSTVEEILKEEIKEVENNI